MGLIRKCDKCRRYYKFESQPNKINVYKKDILNETYVLCDKCTESFINWMKGRIIK